MSSPSKPLPETVGANGDSPVKDLSWAFARPAPCVVSELCGDDRGRRTAFPVCPGVCAAGGRSRTRTRAGPSSCISSLSPTAPVGSVPCVCPLRVPSNARKAAIERSATRASLELRRSFTLVTRPVAAPCDRLRRTVPPEEPGHLRHVRNVHKAVRRVRRDVVPHRRRRHSHPEIPG